MTNFNRGDRVRIRTGIGGIQPPCGASFVGEEGSWEGTPGYSSEFIETTARSRFTDSVLYRIVLSGGRTVAIPPEFVELC